MHKVNIYSLKGHTLLAPILLYREDGGRTGERFVFKVKELKLTLAHLRATSHTSQEP